MIYLEVTAILLITLLVGCWAGNEICKRYIGSLLDYLLGDK